MNPNHNPLTQELTRIVARFKNGDLLKGISQDFSNLRPTFHLQPADGSASRQIRVKDLKAVFFVRSLEGDVKRDDIPGFLSAPMETAQGKKIAVLFQDGELLCGHTLSWTPDREGFFMVPADARSNNLRVYVVSAAAKQVKAGPNAEALAQKLLAERKNRPAA